MPVTKTPDPRNLYLGAGEVFFDRFDAKGNSTGFRHVGLVDSIGLTTTVETKSKVNAMDGAKSTYDETTTGMTGELSMVMTEYTKENLALAFMGTESSFAQEAVAQVQDQAFGPSDPTTLQLDIFYDLKCINPTVTSVKQGATALNPDAYEVNAETGMIRLLSSYTGEGKAVEGTAVTWSGTVPAITEEDGRFILQGMAEGSIHGRLRYISAKNQSRGQRFLVDVWNVSTNPDGELGLITDDYGTFTLKGTIKADMSRPLGQQYFQAISL